MQDSKKCTSKDHDKIDANSFCHDCKIYICKKCENMHSIIFPNHKIYSMSSDPNQIFTGICKEPNHSNKLNYFCNTHNVLCCVECISPIVDKNNGQHKDCEVYPIDKIKEKKKNMLNDNMKSLEQLSSTMNESITEIKKIFEKINSSKEDIKIKVQKIFTKLRNTINSREDEIMLEIDKKYDTLYFKEDIVKECDKLPNKIKVSLEKGKNIDNQWNKDPNKINSLINDCLNIENAIKTINELNETMNKCKSLKINVNFIPDENDIGGILNTIQKFGKISLNHFKFKKCPDNISQSRAYKIRGEYGNILTKTGTDDEWMGTITEQELDKSTECYWKIKILKTEGSRIMIGIAPIDFDINSSMYNKCGWYFYLYHDSLCSGPPHNYNGEHLKIEMEEDESKSSSDSNKKKKRKKSKKKSKKKEESSSEEYEKKKRKKKNSPIKKCVKNKKRDDESDSESISEEESDSKEYKKKSKKKKSISSKSSDSEKIIREIMVIFNFEQKTLKFMEHNKVIGVYNDIIIDKPLFPAIFLKNTNDIIEIDGFS